MLRSSRGWIHMAHCEDCEDEDKMLVIGMVVVDRNTKTNKLIFNSLQQCPKCKAVRLVETNF